MREHELERLHEMVAALECGDDALYQNKLMQLLRERESSLFVSVARLTRELHRAIFEAKPDQEAAQDDACSRLDYVVRLTENAAHKSLDLVDQGRESLHSLQAVGDLLAELPATGSLPLARTMLISGIEALRGQLTQLAQAQEYQDLSGQLIKRVIALVRGVESALLELLRHAGPVPGAAAPVAPPALQGPAVTGLSSSVNQQDADALLSSLGF